jgi:hypothetical protein
MKVSSATTPFASFVLKGGGFLLNKIPKIKNKLKMKINNFNPFYFIMVSKNCLV